MEHGFRRGDERWCAICKLWIHYSFWHEHSAYPTGIIEQIKSEDKTKNEQLNREQSMSSLSGVEFDTGVQDFKMREM